MTPLATHHPPRTLIEYAAHLSTIIDRDPVFTLFMIALVSDHGLPIGSITKAGRLGSEAQQLITNRVIDHFIKAPASVRRHRADRSY